MNNIPVIRSFALPSSQTNPPSPRNNLGKDLDLEQVLFGRSSTVAAYIAAAHNDEFVGSDIRNNERHT